MRRFIRSTYRSAVLARATADAGAICAALLAVPGLGHHRFDVVVEWSDGTLEWVEGAAGPETAGELADVRALLASALSGRGSAPPFSFDNPLRGP
ncbi:hypothetical protein [Streptomyces sp. NBC_01176]|uniref:hypothetical protein n=1 Tax=Streptomyces sp. NBC_01176 TaxID=2903760 RepID=UPI0038703D6C|nr:hypothetical protein OG199_45305 [Streptomyces sp. NBC_01176]